MEKSVVEKSCREVLERSVGEKSGRGMLGRSVGKECFFFFTPLFPKLKVRASHVTPF